MKSEKVKAHSATYIIPAKLVKQEKDVIAVRLLMALLGQEYLGEAGNIARLQNTP